MRNVGLIAFGVTTCVFVPAAVNRLTAGPEQVAKLVAPGEKTLKLGDALIDVSVDRGVIDAGGEVHVKLAASAATGKHLDVGLLVLGSNGGEGDRVQSPPIGVAHQTVRLDVDPAGHASKDVAIKLRGAESGFVPLATYTILVTSPKFANQLERLRSRARLIDGDDEGIPSYNHSASRFMELYWAMANEVEGESEGEDRAKLFAPGSVARLQVHARPNDQAIAMATPDTAQRGSAFTVAVTIKNSQKQALHDVKVELANPAGLLEAEYRGLGDNAVTIEPASQAIDLAAGETKRIEFKVTAKLAGVAGLYARASSDDLYATTFDATEIVETPPVVGKR